MSYYFLHNNKKNICSKYFSSYKQEDIEKQIARGKTLAKLNPFSDFQLSEQDKKYTIIKAMLLESGTHIKFIPTNQIKEFPELIEIAVKQDPKALKYISKIYRREFKSSKNCN